MSAPDGRGESRLRSDMRVGIGYDSHRFDETRPLRLGGVTIPGAAGLSGHSDADAIAHALTDALLGAAAAGDIGTHFPPGDEKWKGADSMGMLKRALSIVAKRRYRVVNADVTVVCEEPRIGPFIDQMRKTLAAALAVDPGAISIKGKTNEGMGWTGRGEGMAAHAVVLIGSDEDLGR